MAGFEEIRDSVFEVISKITGVPATDLDLDKELVEDLDLDSLAIAEVGVGIGESFAIPVPDEAISNFQTVADLVNFVVNAVP